MDAELFGSARFAWKEMAGGICFWISGTQTHYGPFFFGWRFRYVMRLCRYDAIFYSLHSIHNASRLYLVFALFTLVPAILSPKHVPTFPRLYFVFFFLFCSFAAKRALSITRFSTRNFTLTIFFSFCSFSFAQCQFISWLLQHLTANFHFHGSHGSAQERARQQWTRTRQSNGDAFVGAAAAIYIYTFNAQNRIYDDKPFVVGLTKDNGIQVKCANIIKIIQRTVRHHLTIT